MNNLQQISAFVNAKLFPQQSYGLKFVIAALTFGILWRVLMTFVFVWQLELGDSRFYLDAALNIRREGIFGDALDTQSYRPPAYSIFVSLFYQDGQIHLTFLRAGQITISMLCVILVTRITAVLKPELSMVVFLLMLVSPFEAVYSVAILTELLSCLFLLLGFYFLLGFKQPLSWGVAGVCFGLLVLTRDSFLLLPLFINFSILLSPRKPSLGNCFISLPLLGSQYFHGLCLFHPKLTRLFW